MKRQAFTPTPKEHQKRFSLVWGFTLIEIIICLAIIIVMTAAILVVTSGSLGFWSLQASSRALATELRQIQSRAICQHQTLRFNPNNFHLPAGVIFARTAPITFAPSGQTPPGGSGTIILANRLGQTKKIIVSTAGRIRLE